jgi:hypothetical protein
MGRSYIENAPMKRYFVPPLTVSALLLLFAVCCIVACQVLPFGRGSYFGLFAWILLMASVIGFPAFVLINLLDSAFDRFGSRAWVWTGLLIATIAGIGIVRIGDSVDPLTYVIVVSFIVPAMIVAPMSFMRRTVLSRHWERKTIDPKHITRFERLFK